MKYHRSKLDFAQLFLPFKFYKYSKRKLIIEEKIFAQSLTENWHCNKPNCMVLKLQSAIALLFLHSCKMRPLSKNTMFTYLKRLQIIDLLLY